MPPRIPTTASPQSPNTSPLSSSQPTFQTGKIAIKSNDDVNRHQIDDVENIIKNSSNNDTKNIKFNRNNIHETKVINTSNEKISNDYQQQNNNDTMTSASNNNNNQLMMGNTGFGMGYGLGGMGMGMGMGLGGYGGYGMSPYSSYGLGTGMMMGGGPLQGLNQFLFSFQTVVFSLGQAMQVRLIFLIE